LSTLRSAWPVLGRPANRHRTVALTPEQFHYGFANALTVADSRKAYDRYHIPGAGRLLFQAGLANVTPHAASTVDFANSGRAPLLIIAGGDDHIAPPSVNRENARRYRRSTAVTAYREFPGRCHYALGQDGWEQVADFALDWARNPVPLAA
jgi:pimeloyl-ACP methyl ester carboxylesterase